MSRKQVSVWYRAFQNGWVDLTDECCIGRPRTLTLDDNISCVEGLEDRCGDTQKTGTTQYFANKKAWHCLWQSWLQEGVCMLGPTAVEWKQRGAYVFVLRACDLIQMNQLGITWLDHDWPWNLGASCHTRDKDWFRNTQTDSPARRKFRAVTVHCPQLWPCSSGMPKVSLWWISYP